MDRLNGNRPGNERYDAIVVGGGPAGATAATLIAREGGHRVLLLDRERFPRFRLGESLMPATYWTFRRLGVLDKMRASSFPTKHSVQFFSPSGRSTVPFYFSEFDDHESSQTWQVDRVRFDAMMLEHAAENGVEVVTGANVKDVVVGADGAARGVSVELADGDRVDVEADVTVDASGQTALVSRKFGLRETDPRLRHAALYTRYRGAQRDEGRDEGATLVIQTEEKPCWFWYIPLPDDEVSVGLVGPVDTIMKRAGSDPAAYFDEQARASVSLRPRIEHAERVMPVKAIRDFSYVSRRIAGDGWVMAGDSFGFLDPIYSTGVFLALKSAEMAADSVLEGFRLGDFSAAQLGKHGPCYLAGMEAMRKLVYAYYEDDFSFAGFLGKHPECREPMIHLLVGNVFRVPIDGFFEAMAETCPLPEARSLEGAEAGT